jgi:hypothetical protein
MKQSEIIERLAEEVNDATETIRVITLRDDYWDWDSDKYTETSIEIISPSLLARIIQKLADELHQNEIEEAIIQ